MPLSNQPLKSDMPKAPRPPECHWVRDYSTITVPILKDACRIDADDDSNDAFLGIILDAVKDMADAYLQRPSFLEPSSGTGGLPYAINLWVLQVSERLFEQRQNGITRINVQQAQDTWWGEIDYTMLFPYRTFFGM